MAFHPFFSSFSDHYSSLVSNGQLSPVLFLNSLSRLLVTVTSVEQEPQVYRTSEFRWTASCCWLQHVLPQLLPPLPLLQHPKTAEKLGGSSDSDTLSFHGDPPDTVVLILLQ